MKIDLIIYKYVVFNRLNTKPICIYTFNCICTINIIEVMYIKTKLRLLVEEYRSITDDQIYVAINGRNYIDRAFQNRKSELADDICDEVIAVMEKQTELARKYNTPRPYANNLYFDVSCVSYELSEIDDDQITIHFVDYHSDSYVRPEDTETLKFEDLMDFDAKQYEIKMMNRAIANVKSNMKSAKSVSSKSLERLQDKLKHLEKQRAALKD
jgi:hypothetical protein